MKRWEKVIGQAGQKPSSWGIDLC